MAKKNIEEQIEKQFDDSTTFNPLLNALRENDKKNLFKSNAISYFHKTGFPLIDYYFGSVVNVHNELGEIIKQEPMIGQSAGTFNVVLANSGGGKAQPISTRIPTPSGYKLMGDLQVGDIVFDQYGKPTEVIGVFDQGEKNIFTIRFQDGRSSNCCSDHLWNVKKQKDKYYSTTSLKQIMDDMAHDPLIQYQIPTMINPIQYESKPVPVDPYTLGVMISQRLLDDTYLTIGDVDEFISNRISDLNGFYIHEDDCDSYKMFQFYKSENKSNRVKIDDVLRYLPEMIGLHPDKLYIPDIYLYNDVVMRTELVRGLLDAATTISDDWQLRIRYYSNSSKLLNNIRELLWSLGHNSSKINKFSGGKYISINTSNASKSNLYSLPSKLEIIKKHSRIKNKKFNTLRISSIKHSHVELARCIKVSSPDGLYITEDYIVTHNTTIVTQIAANIARQYKNGIVIHYDCESRFDISRGENITKLPIEYFDEDTGSYKLKQGLVTLDEMQEAIVDLYVKKMRMKDQLLIKTGRVNEFNKEIEVLEPTIVIIDSIASVVESSFSYNDTKEVSKAGELRSNTAGARDAKTLKGFLKDITPLCKEANIIIYAINHINSNMSMNAFTGPTKHQNFMKQDEAIPAGKAQIFFAFNMMKLIAKTGDAFTEDKDGFNGHIVTFEPVKSSSNQSGNSSKGVSFDMVLSYKDGFDSLRSLILYGRTVGIIDGNKPKLTFKDDKSFSFNFKNIHTEKEEKPIWDCVKKYIIPELETHLSFVEPTKFDERQLDY